MLSFVPLDARHKIWGLANRILLVLVYLPADPLYLRCGGTGAL